MRRRREDKTQPGPQPGAGHQAAAQAIGDAFGEHDLRCLRNLTPAELAAQADARRALHSYVMAVWEQPKHPAGCWAPWEQSHRPPCRCHEDSDVDYADRHSPANLPEFASVAAVLDLADILWSNARLAQEECGEGSEAP